ncbi:MAG TPA: type II toxin-antitoxin system VapC family toxin [Pyrinomonadaceae bacterium]|nr:type II toxin-antitoxin system VapC family toxin [Pyrinomonadaceae bacterium]
MKIVVDTSVIIAVIANEPEKPLLIEKTRDFELIAPLSLRWEIGNAFSAMIKRGRITLAQAKTALGIFTSLSIQTVNVEMEKVLEIVDEQKVYAYDAYMKACALSHICPIANIR